MADAYGGDNGGGGGGGGYADYSQPPSANAYQSTGYGFEQDYYGQQSQSAYGQGHQSINSGWGRQGGGRATFRGGHNRGAQGGYRSRGFGGGYGAGEGRGNNSGSSGSGMDRGYGGDQRGGFDKGDGSVVQHNTIFVSQMNTSLTEEDIADYFGSIGVIKIDKHTNKKKVWLYKDKSTGMSKGEATVTYDDSNAAQSAISWFNGKDFGGSIIKVQLATKKDNWSGGGGQGGRGGGGQGGRGGGGQGGKGGHGSFGDRGRRGGGGGFGDAGRRFDRVARGRGGGGGGGGDGHDRESRDGDWICPNFECSNSNFAWRTSCNRCGRSKSASVGDGGDEKRESGGRGRYSSSPRGERGFRGFGRARGNDRGRGIGGRGGGGRDRGGRDDGRLKPY